MTAAAAAVMLAVALSIGSSCAAHRPNVTGAALRGIVLSDAERRPVMLGDGLGSVRLIHFFATWCFPCLIDTPIMNQLAREFAGCGLSIVGVGMDLEGAAVLAPFVEMHGIDFPVLVPSPSIRAGESPFGPIRQLPMNFLFDRDGALVEVWDGPAETAQLRSLLKKHLGRCPDQ
jgi:thiol-disulfide isomerase/thioredoxin